MSTPERQIGWYQKYTRNRQTGTAEKAISTYAENGFYAIVSMARNLAGIDIVQTNAPDSWQGINVPEDDLLLELHANTVPGIGIAALREAIGQGYEKLFEYPEELSAVYGADASVVQKYNQALHIVPPDAPNDQLWIPDYYRASQY